MPALGDIGVKGPWNKWGRGPVYAAKALDADIAGNTLAGMGAFRYLLHAPLPRGERRRRLVNSQ